MIAPLREDYVFPDPHLGVVRATSNLSNDKLLVFVHGFAGHPIATWAELAFLIDEDPAFQNYDFCFAGYGMAAAGVSTLGLYLKEVLERAVEGREPFPRKYQDIFVVAHSLGGVAVRSALLYLARVTPVAFRCVRLCVSAAPALFGCQEGLAKLLVRIFVDFGSFLLPIVRDLTDERGEISEVRDGYDSLMQTIPAAHRPRNETYWALYDRIVAPPRIGYYPEPPDTQSTLPFSHASIIRPTHRGHDFYEALVSALSRR